MRNGKRIILAVAVLVAMSLILAGCKSTLAEGLALEKARKQINELDLDALFSEEEGFHYPGIKWGANMTEVQNATNAAITGLYGYSDTGIYIYTAKYLRAKFLGRTNDDATISFLPSGKCYMVALMFSKEGAGTASLSQSEMMEQYYAVLVEKFGEPLNESLTEPDENEQGAETRNYTWEYVTPDGKKTQLQWGEAFMDYSEEPDYLTFGVVWCADELAELQDEAE